MFVRVLWIAVVLLFSAILAFVVVASRNRQHAPFMFSRVSVGVHPHFTPAIHLSYPFALASSSRALSHAKGI